MPVLLRGDARSLPLADASVDLIVTSPPYFALRDYTDAGASMAGQLGAESSPQRYIEALIACTAEWLRVLKPSGSLFVNLGDKYSGAQGHTQTGVHGRRHMTRPGETWRRTDPARSGIPGKSLLLLPERFRVAAVDQLGCIARAVLIWSKPNGLPSSVTDRVRRSHEDWVHLVKQPRYYSAVDELREPHTMTPQRRPRGRGTDRTPRPGQPRQSWSTAQRGERGVDGNALGKLPGSVWEIPTQPLLVPDDVAHRGCCGGPGQPGCTAEVDHYAAFPMVWPRRLILGWSPREVCTACGEGRAPVTSFTGDRGRVPGGGRTYRAMREPGEKDTNLAAAALRPRRISSYACSCPATTAPTRPGVVLDPCGGTGTTALVAAMLGRRGISVDLSHTYTATLATWRAHDPRERARAAGTDPATVAALPRPLPGQLDLLTGEPA